MISFQQAVISRSRNKEKKKRENWFFLFFCCVCVQLGFLLNCCDAISSLFLLCWWWTEIVLKAITHNVCTVEWIRWEYSCSTRKEVECLPTRFFFLFLLLLLLADINEARETFLVSTAQRLLTYIFECSILFLGFYQLSHKLDWIPDAIGHDEFLSFPSGWHRQCK